MALDQATAKDLWNKRYRQELEATARKNKYLDPSGLQDAENLFGELAANVFVKAVNNFDQSKVTYTTDPEQSFNSFFQTIKGQYLANLAAHRETGKQEFFREKQRSIDEPLKGGDEGEGDTFLDLLASHSHDPDMQIDLERLMAELPKNLSDALGFIIENADRGNMTSVMEELKDKYGLTSTRLYNALADQPAFVEFATSL